MTVKKYPIGTKIRFINKNLDMGKKGVIVGYHGSEPTIYVPTAHKHVEQNYYPTLSNGIRFTWYCRWDDIEQLILPNQQLLFNFMER